MIRVWLRLTGWGLVSWAGVLAGTLGYGALSPANVLAFIAPVERYPQVFAVDVETRLLLQLTDIDAFQDGFTYNINSLSRSPDGDEITMEYWEASNAEIMSYDLRRGTLDFRYRGTSGDRAPRWSPNGDKLLFTMLQGNEAYLYLIDAATNRTELLHQMPYYFNFRAYAWSPDSRYIGYYFRRMFVLDTETGALTEVARGYEFDDLEQLVWTPDSCCVVFTATALGARGRNPPRNIYQANVTTGEVTPLLDNPYHEFRPVWLQGRNTLIYQTFDPYGQMRELNLDTGETRYLTEMKPVTVTISPEGRYAAYLKLANVRRAGSNEQLWVEDLRTGRSFPLTPPEMAPRDPIWKP